MVNKGPSSKIGTIALSLSAMFITLLIQIYLLSEIGITIFTEEEIKGLVLQYGPSGLIFLPFNRIIILIFLASLLTQRGRLFKNLPFNLPLFVSRVIRDINIYFAIFAAISLWILDGKYVASAFWITFVSFACYYLHHDCIIECITTNGENKILKKSKENFLESQKLRLSIAGINHEKIKVEASSGNIDVKEMIIEKGYGVSNIKLRDSPVELEVLKMRNSHRELLTSYTIVTGKEELDIKIEIRDKYKELFKDTVTVKERDMSLREALEELFEQAGIDREIKKVLHEGKERDVNKSFKELGLWDGDEIYVVVKEEGET